MRSIIIIPARLESTRLNRKLLLPGPGTDDLPLLYYTWRQAKNSSADEIYIATDNSEIIHEAARFGAITIRTRKDHNCGTNRIAEANDQIISTYKHPDSPDYQADCIINLQGDEPEIRGEDINTLITRFETFCAEDTDTKLLPSWMKIATLAVPLYRYSEYCLPQNVKVVFDEDDQEAIYFSRGMIPYVGPPKLCEWRIGTNKPIAYKHLGIYAYTSQMLKEFTKTAASRLEDAEGLEQMRAIENQWPILVIPIIPPESDQDNTWPLGINTQQDYHTWLTQK